MISERETSSASTERHQENASSAIAAPTPATTGATALGSVRGRAPSIHSLKLAMAPFNAMSISGRREPGKSFGGSGWRSPRPGAKPRMSPSVRGRHLPDERPAVRVHAIGEGHARGQQDAQRDGRGDESSSDPAPH